MSQEIVPFGKYRGRPVSDMLSDSPYMSWLTMQGWFRERYQNLYVLVTQDVAADNAPTPEHNAIQIRFADPFYRAYVLALVTDASAAPAPPGMSWADVDVDALPEDVAALVRAQQKAWHPSSVNFECERLGWDVILQPANAHLRFENPAGYRDEAFIELKPTVGDEYAAIARTVKARSTVQAVVNGQTRQLSHGGETRVVAFDQWQSVQPLSAVRQLFADIKWVQLPPWPLLQP